MQLKSNSICISLLYQMEKGEKGIRYVPARLDQSLKAIAIFYSLELSEKESAEFLTPEMKNKVII